MRAKSSSTDPMPVVVLSLMGLGIVYTLVRPKVPEWCAAFIALQPPGRLLAAAMVIDGLALAALLLRGVRLLETKDSKPAAVASAELNAWRVHIALTATVLIALLLAFTIFIRWAGVLQPSGALNSVLGR